MPVALKVCRIASAEEARVAVEAGASALGLVLAMPSGPGVIAESLIAEIAASVPPGVETFLLTSRTEGEAIAAQLDSGRPDRAVKELGGTGRTHNWDLSREVVAAVAKPVYLAGGIRLENVRAAIDAVRPYGIDLCTGVRSEGWLDPVKLGPVEVHFTVVAGADFHQG